MNLNPLSFLCVVAYGYFMAVLFVILFLAQEGRFKRSAGEQGGEGG